MDPCRKVLRCIVAKQAEGMQFADRLVWCRKPLACQVSKSTETTRVPYNDSCAE
jgi:hypothetical protein